VRCDPTAPRTSEEQASFDIKPLGREFGAKRLAHFSRVRRELNSILRRCEKVAIVKRGKVVSILIPALKVERLNEATASKALTQVLWYTSSVTRITPTRSR